MNATSSTTNNSTTLRAGVIGLGQIGGGVAICLARHQRLLEGPNGVLAGAHPGLVIVTP